METQAVFQAFQKDQEFELLRLWRSSFNGAIGLEEDRREEAFQEHLGFLRSLDPGCIRVALEKTTNQMMGFMRKEGTTIHDLFIHTEHQRAGLGSEFIRQAKEENDFFPSAPSSSTGAPNNSMHCTGSKSPVGGSRARKTTRGPLAQSSLRISPTSGKGRPRNA